MSKPKTKKMAKTKAKRTAAERKAAAAARRERYMARIPTPGSAADPIIAFMNGAYDRLLASFTASAKMSNTTKGTIREKGFRAALERAFPPVAKVYGGDVIDSDGTATGQLDFVVTHSTAPAFGSQEDEPRLILAEGVLGVVEMKSDLSSQWSQVERTWKKLRKIRRPPRTIGFKNGQFHIGSPLDPADHAIPYYVVAKTGWADHGMLVKKLRSLVETFEGDDPPRVALLQLTPPRSVVYEGQRPDPTNGKPKLFLGQYGYWNDVRGLVLMDLLHPISEAARSTVFQPINWGEYFRPFEAAKHAAMTGEEGAADGE